MFAVKPLRMTKIAAFALGGLAALLFALMASAAEIAPPHRGACLSDGFPTKYDRLVRQAWHRHAGAEHADRVCRFVSQIRKESSARADARSGAGAVGLGQQLESAATDCRRLGGLRGRRVDARFSAGCAAWLMSRHMRAQREQRPALCRHRNAELAYVSGPGHVWKGQRVARDRLGLLARCPDDGILAGMEMILRPEAYREASGYPAAIDRLERRAVP